MERIAKHNMILATGHVGRQEIFAIVKEAAGMGLKEAAGDARGVPVKNLTGDDALAYLLILVGDRDRRRHRLHWWRSGSR